MIGPSRTGRATLCALVATAGLAMTAGVLVGAGMVQAHVVLSGSMAPDMPAGSVVITRPMPVADVAVGDVITFNSPIADHHLVTHRIIEIVERGPRPVVRTKGDASDAPDPWRARLEDDTAWKSAIVVPRLGYLITALRQPWLRFVTLAVAPLLLAALALGAIWARPPVPSTS